MEHVRDTDSESPATAELKRGEEDPGLLEEDDEEDEEADELIVEASANIVRAFSPL